MRQDADTRLIIQWSVPERPDAWDLPTAGVGSIYLPWPWLARAAVRGLRWLLWWGYGR